MAYRPGIGQVSDPTEQAIAQLQEQVRTQDQVIRAMSERLDSFRTPGANALRPIGDWAEYWVTITHGATNGDVAATPINLSDQWEYWLVHLVIVSTSGDALSTTRFRMRDSRSSRYNTGDGGFVRTDLMAGTATQPYILTPPRVYGEQIGIDSRSTSGASQVYEIKLGGILVPIKQASGGRY